MSASQDPRQGVAPVVSLLISKLSGGPVLACENALTSLNFPIVT
jgi:hypothetical protein